MLSASQQCRADFLFIYSVPPITILNDSYVFHDILN